MIDRDEATARVMRELRENGRASYTSMATKLGLSRRQVTEIVEQGIEQGRLKITATISPELLGKHRFAHLLIAVDRVDPVIAELERMPELCFICAIAGGYDIDAEIRVGDEPELEVALDRIRAIPGVRRVLVSPFERIAVSVDSAPGVASGSLSVDDADLAIAHMLERDGRAPFRKLAEAAGISTANARTRLLRLISLGAVKVVGLPTGTHRHRPPMLGVGIRVNGPVGEAVAALERLLPEFLVATKGLYEIIGTFSSGTNHELHDILESVRALPQVAEVDSWAYLRIIRESYGLQDMPSPRRGARIGVAAA